MLKETIKKSKTLNFAVVVTVFGIIELNLPLVKENLGNYYGYVFIGIAIIVAVLRKLTTKPLNEK